MVHPNTAEGQQEKICTESEYTQYALEMDREVLEFVNVFRFDLMV